ncbi:MAG: universal stress protein, partial [Desulfatitalea sp.]|nr:universal stress protein [Desulfatitalea sp.]
MKKKIAIAVDGSIYCVHAIRYAAALTPALPDLHYVLLNIQPAVSQYLCQEAEANPQTQRALERLLEANDKNARQALEKARGQLLQCGIAPDCIELRTCMRINGVAQDILDICQASQYDAVVVGRRGLSRMQELITGSVTANLLAHSQWTPIWMVDGEVTHPKILMAADGSPNSLRALDHLAFMLHGNAQAALHVVHVKPRLQDILALDLDKETMAVTEEVLASSTRQRIDLFAVQAQEVILKNGLKTDQLHVQTIESRFAIAGAILDAAREGGFGTIVIGRSG